MAKFRKKPIVIEAVQWAGPRDTNRIVNWLAHNKANVEGWVFFDACIDIPTLEGTKKAIPGDWIIKGVNGEYYPCKPDIFEKSYEAEGVGGQPLTWATVLTTLESLFFGGCINPDGVPIDDLLLIGKRIEGPALPAAVDSSEWKRLWESVRDECNRWQQLYAQVAVDRDELARKCKDTCGNNQST